MYRTTGMGRLLLILRTARRTLSSTRREISTTASAAMRGKAASTWG
ncbi:MAG: hypothetical protein PVJ66_03995 [Gammaproteobacteria bacterium]